MKKASILFFILFYMVAPSQAQRIVPGFIGKKLIVSAGVMAFPALNSTYKRTDYIMRVPNTDYKRFYGMNWVKSLGIDYTFSRKITLGIEYQNFRTSSYAYHAEMQPSGYYESVKDIRFVFANSVGFNLKIFNENKGAIAPIGHYQKIGLSAIATSSYDSSDMMSKTLPMKSHFLALTYGFGKTEVFLKCLTFSYGIDMTVILDREFATKIADGKAPRYYDAGFVRSRSLKLINCYISMGYIF